ncbi:D-2-hydroxyacid dehydrogenase [Rossellomorea vietnamensis]|uniref:D-2-hydroxyacid dehydrogenase n=1 Tax=Rossellomorea vietnamensis TaxID=218284 RepID=A0A5D4M1D6_9BACI|nr:D-2-hydroxyacid dehydrogenase [Rossellomorea vietnamensis]TYR95352.1 D-2-hydroxyacid dehydrogenase [Rossellomorea vietnamensis]
MKVLYTFHPSEKLTKDIEAEFPDCEYEYCNSIQQAWDSLREAEVIVTFGEDLTDDHIRQAENLRWIMVMSAGLELMPLKLIEEKGILVTNVKGIHAVPMAEFALGSMLQHAKQFPRIKEEVSEGLWKREVPSAELYGKTLLILGAGAIGSEIARLGKAFRMKVLGINTSGNIKADFDEMHPLKELKSIVGTADYVISVLPSTIETRYLLKKEHFQCMKKSSVFINIGRGDLFESSILIDALQNNELAHACLDVFEREPLEKNHPFWKMEKVTITPHLSSRTEQYLPRSFDIFRKNLTTYINNENDYINKIQVERGY